MKWRLRARWSGPKSFWALVYVAYETGVWRVLMNDGLVTAGLWDKLAADRSVVAKLLASFLKSISNNTLVQNDEEHICLTYGDGKRHVQIQGLHK